MKVSIQNGAKLIIFFYLLSVLSSCNFKLFNKRGKGNQQEVPEDIAQMYPQANDYGMKLSNDEKAKFAKISKRAKLSKKEQMARTKLQTGMKMSLIDKYRLARANRKAYVCKRKTAKLKRKVVKRRQPTIDKKRAEFYVQLNKKRQQRKKNNGKKYESELAQKKIASYSKPISNSSQIMAKERMKAERKRIKKRDRQARRKEKWKIFKNLFR